MTRRQGLTKTKFAKSSLPPQLSSIFTTAIPLISFSSQSQEKELKKAQAQIEKLHIQLKDSKLSQLQTEGELKSVQQSLKEAQEKLKTSLQSQQTSSEKQKEIQILQQQLSSVREQFRNLCKEHVTKVDSLELQIRQLEDMHRQHEKPIKNLVEQEFAHYLESKKETQCPSTFFFFRLRILFFFNLKFFFKTVCRKIFPKTKIEEHAWNCK